MQRNRGGSVVQDKRSGVWNYFWWEEGKRRSRVLGSFPSRTAAYRAAELLRERMRKVSIKTNLGPTVAAIVEAYRTEKMPERYSTRRSYEVWIRGYVLPRWGLAPITDVQARPVERWLQSLELAPKSRAHIRGLLGILWDHAMWRGDVPVGRNPMGLVTIKDVSKRVRQPRSLTVEEFQRFNTYLQEPFHIIALVCVCFGLRISECLALKWSDVDWLNRKLRVERGIVRQRVSNTKTIYSQRQMSIDPEMLEALKTWKQVSQFSGPEDWMFASPVKLGRQPWSYDQVWRCFLKAGDASGIGKLGTHSMRHTYRSWLDAVGTSVAVQQKLMRHADIRTTMNVYGDIVTDEMSVATGKVTRLALNGRETAGRPS